jgi:hypothetical protein
MDAEDEDDSTRDWETQLYGRRAEICGFQREIFLRISVWMLPESLTH